MGDMQLFVIQNQIIVEQDIQIQGSRPPAEDALTLGLLLDLVETGKELVGRQKCPDLHVAV